MNAPVREPRPLPASIQAHAREALPALAAALGLPERTPDIVGLIEAMTEPWGGRPLADFRERRSNVADDQSPYAFALSLGPDGGDVHLLLEAQADDPSPAAQWSTARAATKRLSERYGLALGSVARVEELFEPAAGSRAATWHAVTMGSADAAPRFEILFDAHAQGRWKARALVEEALVRLGLGHAWPDLAEKVLRRGPYADDLAYFGVELAREGLPQPSVKVYVRRFDATVEDLRGALGASPLAARVEELLLALTGSLGPYRGRPVLSSHTFGDPRSPAPTGCALYVPAGAHAPSDAVVRGRVSAYLALHGLPYDAYEAALAGYARRPLAARAGLQGYVSLRDDGRVTVELSPEVRPVTMGGASTAPEAARGDVPRTSVEEIVHRFENDIVLADHPFMRRLAREPVKLEHLWALIANFWEGVVHDFPTRLSHVVAEIDDDRVRSVLTKQMNDELGEGDYAEAHKPMFRKLLEAVTPYRIKGPDEVLTAPGRAFGHEIWTLDRPGDPYERIGRMMMIEIYGKQTDMFMGSQFRRQTQVDSASLRWLHLHEDLEVDHAEDSFDLARCVPDDPAAIASTWRGAEAIVTAGRRYFDALYRICFP